MWKAWLLPAHTVVRLRLNVWFKGAWSPSEYLQLEVDGKPYWVQYATFAGAEFAQKADGDGGAWTTSMGAATHSVLVDLTLPHSGSVANVSLRSSSSARAWQMYNPQLYADIPVVGEAVQLVFAATTEAPWASDGSVSATRWRSQHVPLSRAYADPVIACLLTGNSVAAVNHAGDGGAPHATVGVEHTLVTQDGRLGFNAFIAVPDHLYRTAGMATGWHEEPNICLNRVRSGGVELSKSDPVDSLQDCTNMCMALEDCVAASWRSGGVSHANYHKCFFMSSISSESEWAAKDFFESVIRPASTAAADWTSSEYPTIPESASGDGMVMGLMAQARVSATFSELPVHTTLRIKARFWAIDSWDGETAQMSVDEQQQWSQSHALNDCAGTLYDGYFPSHWESDNYPHGSMNCYYDIDQTISHTASSATLSFHSSINQALSDESWAVNRIEVFVDGTPIQDSLDCASGCAEELPSAFGEERASCLVVEAGEYALETDAAHGELPMVLSASNSQINGNATHVHFGTPFSAAPALGLQVHAEGDGSAVTPFVCARASPCTVDGFDMQLSPQQSNEAQAGALPSAWVSAIAVRTGSASMLPCTAETIHANTSYGVRERVYSTDGYGSAFPLGLNSSTVLVGSALIGTGSSIGVTADDLIGTGSSAGDPAWLRSRYSVDGSQWEVYLDEDTSADAETKHGYSSASLVSCAPGLLYLPPSIPNVTSLLLRINPLEINNKTSLPYYDVTAPEVVGYYPLHGEVNVSPATQITLTFSETVLPGEGSFTLTAHFNSSVPNSTTVVNASNSDHVEFYGSTITFHPPTDLVQKALYSLSIEAGLAVVDPAGNSFAGLEAFSYSFVVADVDSPALAQRVPHHGATDVAANTTIQLTFSEAVQAGVGDITLSFEGVSCGTQLEHIVVAVDSSAVTFDGPTMLIQESDSMPTCGARCHVSMPAGAVLDTHVHSTNPFSGLTSYEYFFDIADTVPPAVVSYAPTSGTQDVSADASITLTLSEAIALNTASSAPIMLRCSSPTQSIPMGVAAPGCQGDAGAQLPLPAASTKLQFVPSGEDSLLISTRCCHEDEQCVSADSDGCLPSQVGLLSARQACTTLGEGWGLCSEKQLNAGLCCGSGCLSDQHYIWTSDHNLDAGGNNSVVEMSLHAEASENQLLLHTASILPTSGVECTLLLPEGVVSDVAGNMLDSTLWLNYSFSVADTWAPIVVTSSPQNAESNVSVLADIVVTFSETIKLSPDANITLHVASSLALWSELTPAVSGHTLTLQSASSLMENTQYTVSIPEGSLLDLNSNPFAGLALGTYSFVTWDITAPKLLEVSPVHNATDVSPFIANLTLLFSEPVQVAATDPKCGVQLVPVLGVPLPLRVPATHLLAVGSTVYIQPDGSLPSADGGKCYGVELAAGCIRDLAGLPFPGSASDSWSFCVADTVKPALVKVSPSAGSTVAAHASFLYVFSEAVQPCSSIELTWSLGDMKGSESGSASASTQAHSLKLTSTVAMQSGAEYAIQPFVVCDDAGNNVTVESSHFSVQPSSDSSLAELDISASTLHPAFVSKVKDYTVAVDYAVSSFLIDVQPSSSVATWSLWRTTLTATEAVPKGTAAAIEHSQMTEFAIKVSAQDSSTSTYRIYVTRDSPPCEASGIGPWGPWSPCEGKCSSGTTSRKRTVVPEGCAPAVNRSTCVLESQCEAKVEATTEMVGISTEQFSSPSVTNAFKASVAAVLGSGVVASDVRILSVKQVASKGRRLLELRIVVDFTIEVPDASAAAVVSSQLDPVQQPSIAGELGEEFVAQAKASGEVVQVVMMINSAPTVIAVLHVPPPPPPPELDERIFAVYLAAAILLILAIMLLWLEVATGFRADLWQHNTTHSESVLAQRLLPLHSFQLRGVLRYIMDQVTVYMAVLYILELLHTFGLIT